MPAPDKQLSAEQSRQIADTIREEIARRRISRQSLAEHAKLSLSTLEKVLGGRRPFTLATTVRLEQALGVSLRKTPDAPAPAAPNGNGDIAPDGLGAYSRRAVAWIEGTYVTVRPSFGDKEAVFAYRTEIAWDDGASSPRVSRERAAGRGLHPVRRSGGAEPVGTHLSRHQPARPASPDHGGAAGDFGRDVRHHHDAARGPRLAVDADRRADRLSADQDGRHPTFGRVSSDDPNYALYRQHLRRTTDELFALFLPG